MMMALQGQCISIAIQSDYSLQAIPTFLIGKDTHERLDHMGLDEQGVPLRMIPTNCNCGSPFQLLPVTAVRVSQRSRRIL